MKFLCTKVKELWLTSPKNREQVTNCGLLIKGQFIGIQIKSDNSTNEEYNLVDEALGKLFAENKKAFPIRLLEI